MTTSSTTADGDAGRPAFELADRVADAFLAAQPLMATYMGVPGYDDRLPDLSPEARDDFRAALVSLYRESLDLPVGADTPGVVVAASREHLRVALGVLDAPIDDFTVTGLPLSDGPGQLQFMLAQVGVTDPAAADAYLARCRAVPRYLQQLTERLQGAVRAGRTPVAPLVDSALRQCDTLLAEPESLVLTPGTGAGLPDADQWRATVASIARDEVAPALAAYAETLRSVRGSARHPDRAGLLYVPGGSAAYAMCVRAGTTLSLDADEIHAIGRAELAATEERISELGGRAFGTGDRAEIFARLRAVPPVETDEAALLAHFTRLVRRAEELTAHVLPDPAAPPCDVEPMPAAIADAGTPPMYRPPAQDGSRPGAYMCNTRHPGPAATYAVDAVTFHETVPGHHTQSARLQHVGDLPLLLTAFNVVPYGEGWGLYSERLADELGLYSDDVQRLGMLVTHAWRAVRLIVDTGIHARGWSRADSLRFALERTGLPEEFMAAEIDRYIAVPGQALGYLIGQRELLALREEARARAGGSLDLAQFHAAVLGHGSVPLPVLRLVVTEQLS